MGSQGIFSRQWLWNNQVLQDKNGRQLATVVGDILTIEGSHLLLERSTETMSFELRATEPGGIIHSVTQPGFSVSLLQAVCGEHRYRLTRVKLWRKNREIYRMGTALPVARTEPLWDGALRLLSTPDVPLTDLVFLSYACTQVDQPELNTKI